MQRGNYFALSSSAADFMETSLVEHSFVAFLSNALLKAFNTISPLSSILKVELASQCEPLRLFFPSRIFGTRLTFYNRVKIEFRI